ncbi:MAG: flagellar export chaperone FliS [Candidatus Palauibacterales bacterium]|nr:flagellar export chaperone FliS [Candidatus Palauibacterales bacterium]
MSYGNLSQRNASAYQSNEVLSRSEERLVPLLYRPLLKHLRRAREGIDERAIDEKAEHVGQALDILWELIAALDPEADEELTGNLISLYTFFIEETRAASSELDPERLDRVIDLVDELHEAWETAAEKVAAEQDSGDGRGELAVG